MDWTVLMIVLLLLAQAAQVLVNHYHYRTMRLQNEIMRLQNERIDILQNEVFRLLEITDEAV